MTQIIRKINLLLISELKIRTVAPLLNQKRFQIHREHLC